MNKGLTVILAALSFSASASVDLASIGDLNKAEAKLILGFASRHFESNSHKYLNEFNPAIGIEAWDIQAVYIDKNSWNKKSLYLTYTPDYRVNDHLSLSLSGGIATGYKCSNFTKKGNHTHYINFCSGTGIIPFYAATIDYSPFADNFSVSVSINHSVAMLSVNYSLK